MPGSVRIRLEQISAVTDSAPEQRRPDRTITNNGMFVQLYVTTGALNTQCDTK